MTRRPVSRGPKRDIDVARAERVNVDARRLVTIGPDDPLWSDAEELVELILFEGAIVRMIPSVYAPELAVQELEERVRKVAAAVKLLPAVGEERVVVEAKPIDPASRMNTRQVIEQMVQEARTQNRELLVEVVDESLTAAGL